MPEGFKRLAPRLLFTFALAAGCLWYLWDAASQSTRVDNLLLLLPATVVAILLCIAVIVEDIAEWRRAGHASQSAEDRATRLDLRIPVLMVLVGAYIAVLITVGFADLATFVFIAVTLVLLGERRPWLVAVYSGAFTFAVVSGLKAALSYDVPTLLF